MIVILLTALHSSLARDIYLERLGHIVPDLCHDTVIRPEPLLFWQEAKRLVKAGLPIPAYMQLLKLSHSFNIMDSRGAVGVTLRATCFGAMRSLAKQIAGATSGTMSSCQ